MCVYVEKPIFESRLFKSTSFLSESWGGRANAQGSSFQDFMKLGKFLLSPGLPD